MQKEEKCQQNFPVDVKDFRKEMEELFNYKFKTNLLDVFWDEPLPHDNKESMLAFHNEILEKYKNDVVALKELGMVMYIMCNLWHLANSEDRANMYGYFEYRTRAYIKMMSKNCTPQERAFSELILNGMGGF